MRRLLTTTAIATLVALMTGSAAAQDQDFVGPLDVLIDAFEAPEGAEYVVTLVEFPISDLGTFSDPVGDFEHSSGEDPGFTPDHIDIVHTWSLDFVAGPLEENLFGPTDQNGFWAPTGSFLVEPPNYEPFHTFTGEEIHDGSQYADGAVLFEFRLAGTPIPPVPGRCEYVIWINDPLRGATFVNHPSFPGDPAAGTNVAFGLGLNPEGQGLSATFALEYQEGSGFIHNPLTDVRSFITPDYVGITVPTSQIGEMAAVNFYTFCAEKGFTFEPESTGADQTGLIEVTINDLGVVAIQEQTVVVSTTTVPESTTTVQEKEPAAATEQSDAALEEPGFPWWFVLIGGGLALAIAGWILFREKDDPCKKLLDAWIAAQKSCDDAQRAADDAANDCEEADLDLNDLEDERKDLCKIWPPACWKTEDGGWMQDDRGNRITSRDVHMRKMALGEVWDDYKAGKMTATQVEAKWTEMDTPDFRKEMRDNDKAFKEQLAEIDGDIEDAQRDFDQACELAEKAQTEADVACGKAEAAKKAYEECVSSKVAEAEAAAVASASVSSGSGTDGPTSTEPGSTAPSAMAIAGSNAKDPCEGVDPKRRVRKTGASERPLRVNVDFSVISEVSEGSGRNVTAGKQMVIDLDDVASSLDFFGDMLSAQSAGLHIGKATGGFRQGKYLATTEGVIKGGIEGGMATGVLPEMPTSPLQAGTEVLEQTARLGKFVASKVTEWMANYQIFEVRRTYFYQEITATPAVIEECRKGQGWVCVQKIWEIDVSKLLRHRGKKRTWTINSRQLRYRYRREIQRLSESSANRIKNDARALVAWRAKHEPGPCDP